MKNKENRFKKVDITNETICQRIVYLAEDILDLKFCKLRATDLRFIFARLSPSLPSNDVLQIEQRIEREISDRRSQIRRYIRPLLQNHKFDIESYDFGSKDLLKGYIKLISIDDNKEYILFLKPFNNGIVEVLEGQLLSNDNNQLYRILRNIKPFPRRTDVKSIYGALLNQRSKK